MTLYVKRAMPDLPGFPLNLSVFVKYRDMPHACMRKGFEGTVVNQILPSLHGGSLEVRLTVPSTQYTQIKYINYINYIK